MAVRKRKREAASSADGLTLLGAGRTPFPRSPDEARLETFPNAHASRDYWIRLECPEFTSLCPVTGQPDFGSLLIEYVPDRHCVESKSLKLYLFAFRNHGVFHEAVVNRIADDLLRALAPRKLRVTGNFRPRGGIAIHVQVEHP